jgi:hypothetical protein
MFVVVVVVSVMVWECRIAKRGFRFQKLLAVLTFPLGFVYVEAAPGLMPP